MELASQPVTSEVIAKKIGLGSSWKASLCKLIYELVEWSFIFESQGKITFLRTDPFLMTSPVCNQKSA